MKRKAHGMTAVVGPLAVSASLIVGGATQASAVAPHSDSGTRSFPAVGTAHHPSLSVAKGMWKAVNAPYGEGLACHKTTQSLGVWGFTQRHRQWGYENLALSGCANGISILARKRGGGKWTSVTGFNLTGEPGERDSICQQFRPPTASVRVPNRVIRELSASQGARPPISC